MGISPMSRQHRQQNGSQHVPLFRRVPTAVVQRAILYPPVEQAAGLQKFDEEYHQTQTANAGLRRPLYMDFAGKRIHAGYALQWLFSCPFAFTFWVNPYHLAFVAHVEQ